MLRVRRGECQKGPVLLSTERELPFGLKLSYCNLLEQNLLGSCDAIQGTC